MLTVKQKAENVIVQGSFAAAEPGWHVSHSASKKIWALQQKNQTIAELDPAT